MAEEEDVPAADRIHAIDLRHFIQGQMTDEEFERGPGEDHRGCQGEAANAPEPAGALTGFKNPPPARAARRPLISEFVIAQRALAAQGCGHSGIFPTKVASATPAWPP
jgi:hypothetical protein